MSRVAAIAIGIVVLAAAAAGAWFYVNGTEEGFGPEDDAVREDVRPAETGAEPTAAPESAASADSGDREAAAAETEGPFEALRVQVSTKSDEPEACLVFSRRLDATGETDYQEYIRVSPRADYGVYAEDVFLCLTGLDYAKSYSVTVREGLPSATGEKTAGDQTLSVELKDRPSAVHFGKGLILPRQVAKGVPIATVNVERLKIRIYRVGDRILARMRYHVLDDRTLSQWEQNNIADDEGALVWEGEMDVPQAERNQTTETVFPFREAIPGDKPGAYLIVAENAEEEEKGNSRRYRRMAGQWVIDSDLGITSFSGGDGLHLFVRSLRTAQPLSGVRLALIAKNNEILGEARTDGQGAVRFDPGLTRGEGGMRPVAVMAYGANNDFNYLDLRRPAHDLSDRGVGGRAVPGPVDAYVYLDRGIYRPGETVHAVTMLRDRKAAALQDAPLTLVIRRPDGIEYRKLVLNDQKAGAAHAAVELSRTAPRGRWQAVAYTDPEGDPVGRAGFAVQDFVPERLAVGVEPRTERFVAGEEFALDVTARFLYGAPAVGLEGEAELTLSRDPQPFPEYKAYRFGRVTESVPDRVIELEMTDTDEEGHATVSGTLKVAKKLTNPLRARVRVSVFEPGGRSTDETVSVPVQTGDVLLGVKKQFEGSSVAEGEEAGFGLIAVDGEGERIAREDVGFKLVRIAYRYQWFYRDNRWRYEWTSTESVVEEGTLDISSDAPEQLTRGLDPGSYRFEVADKASGAATSVNFHVGWWSGGRQGPDNVAVVADKPKYKTGDTARLTVTPPVAGKALIVIARDRMFESRLVDLPKEGRTIDVKVSEDWGSGAYVLVTAYRPLAEGSPRAPVRAVGVSWLQVDQSDRTFEVSMEGPEKVDPETTVTVPVSVRANGEAPDSAFVTLAAVDEGILQLTNFSSPAPEDYYFAKLRLAFDMRDDYGRLIEASDAVMGEIRSGGGAPAAEPAMLRATGGGLDTIPTRTVALFSGIVELDDEGNAQIPVEVPDFAGELRLMAVAFSAGALGSGDRPLTVRRDVVGEMTLPRFLAPGDVADANLSLHNVEGPSGTYRAEIKLTGAVAGEGETAFDVELGEGQRRDLPVGLTGTQVGIGTIRLSVTGPNDFRLEREWSIQVRPAQPPVMSSTVSRLEPGESLSLNAETHADRVPGTAAVSVTLSQTPAYDVPGLLRALDRYPYGCLEQTVSRAFPLLYFTDLSLLVDSETGLEKERSIRQRVNQATERILDMQRSNGSFGMWSFRGQRAHEWLSVFALDFLIEAKARNYFVPDDPVERGMEHLDRIAGTNRNHEIRAYAFYVLAKAGRVNLGDLRYFHDNHAKRLEDAMSHALLGAALDLSGDRARGADAFETAANLALETDEDYKPVRYGSRLRDVSGVIALAARSERDDLVPELLDLAHGLDRGHRYTTTQEKMWMLMAAHALSEGGTPPEVEVNSRARAPDGPVITLTPDIGEVDAGYTVKNTGDSGVWYVLTVDGVPQEPLSAVSEGVTLKRSFFTLDGEPADLSSVRQNGRLVVVLEGEVESGRWWGREMVLLDLLPAGFDIEAPVRDNKLYPWLKPAPTHATHVSPQDDRYVTSFRTRWSKKKEKDSFKQVYVVRAVTPGRYVVPPAAVEDMYAPRIHARTEAAELTVIGAGETASGPEDDGE
ncbi:MAG: alpha-2-macroglobulin family protein [Alphaproteobacteria bacterium]